jgi:hypothetical protein
MLMIARDHHKISPAEYDHAVAEIIHEGNKRDHEISTALAAYDPAIGHIDIGVTLTTCGRRREGAIA